MTRIADILDIAEFTRALSEGYIRIQVHPDYYNLAIANYTDKCAFDRAWTETTRACRGLIWDTETGEVLARPFPKFFNWDEKEAPRILDDQVLYHWADKADGSLGIMYQIPGSPATYAIATRGSFASEQAALGTELLSQMGSTLFTEYTLMMDEGYTPLFEIVGPDNRIVLRYEENALVPLGYIHVGTGEFVAPAGAQRRTMRELLGDLSRSNAEGWVAWLSNRQVVKIKQADYIELHRMVSNLTPKEVWRQLRAGTFNEYVQHLPDELFQLACGWANPLKDDYTNIRSDAEVSRDVVTIWKKGLSRKEQAAWIQAEVPAARRGLVFGLLDGKDISDSIWKMLEPSGLDRG